MEQTRISQFFPKRRSSNRKRGHPETTTFPEPQCKNSKKSCMKPWELPAPPEGASVSATLSKMAESVTICVATSSDIKDDPMLKGVSADLVNKIRAKEASMAKATMAAAVDTQTQQKLQMIEDFPYVVRIIRNYFASERKTAMILKHVTQKIVESRSGLAPDRMEDYMRYLEEDPTSHWTFDT